MFKSLFFLVFAFSILTVLSQEYPVKIYNNSIDFFILPDQLKETSGVIYYNKKIWTFNDSGGKPVLFALRNNGTIIQKIRLIKGKNYDWEDITSDSDYIYIGDFGNNFGSRKNLRIYKIDKSDIPDSGNFKIPFKTISFSYEDQIDFKPQLRNTMFDCEALISYNDELVLFTKDWINMNSTIYSIPKEPGKQTAKKISTLKINGLITGATIITPDIAAACGRNQSGPIIILINLNSWQILKMISFPLLKASQIEGITSNENYIFLSSEQGFLPARCFKIRINDVFE